MADQYLTLAEEVLQIHGRPLTAHQILREARRYDLMPAHLYGETQHKTLQARISDNIHAEKSSSRFYRVGVGRYFLRELSDDPTLPRELVQEKRFSGRTEKIDAQRLLHTHLPEARADWERKVDHAIECVRESNRFEYPVFPLKSELLVGTFTIVVRGNSILLHNLGSFSWFYEQLGERGSCLGFRRYISEFDDDIFSEFEFGIDLSSAREVLRNISLKEDHERLDDRDIRRKLLIKSVCLDKETSSAFFVVVTKLSDFGNRELAFRGRKDVRRLRWVDLSEIENEKFDRLSSRVLSSGVLNDLHSK
ncbi:MAG: winged helix-turn-helix domain-containing protein [Roseovarius pacificus]|nr:winged helix-turn-helix domain-containing protein [Roseovarius pacificus]